jgi:hypothetical protein
LILQWWRNSAQIYIINEISVIVRNYVYMKIIIEDVSQKLTFNILNIKYNVILEMLWLHNRNSKINWINKKLYVMKHAYKISEQLKMYLLEHKLWDHEIFLSRKQFKWMLLYFMSENQLKRSETILMRILKENSLNH